VSRRGQKQSIFTVGGREGGKEGGPVKKRSVLPGEDRENHALVLPNQRERKRECDDDVPFFSNRSGEGGGGNNKKV